VFDWRRRLVQAGMLMAGGALVLLAALLGTVAGWLVLEARVGAVWANLLVAAGCLGTGLILLALGMRRHGRRVPRRVTARDEAALRAVFAELGLELPAPGTRPPLLEAFLFGLATARRLRRDRRR
jgi:hypothetical protein